MKIWTDNKVYGFRLDWFLQDSKGSRLTEVVPEIPAYWETHNTAPRFQHDFLKRLTFLSKEARINGIIQRGSINDVITKKERLIQRGVIQYNSMCFENQIMVRNYTIFDGFNLGQNITKNGGSILEEDIKTGFMIFSALVSGAFPISEKPPLHPEP